MSYTRGYEEIENILKTAEKVKTFLKKDENQSVEEESKRSESANRPRK